MTSITLYEGPPGAGRTYALTHHPTPSGARRIDIDLLQHTHRSLLITILDACDTPVPRRATIIDLVDIAVDALAEHPMLLLFDNVDKASEKTVPTIARLLDAAAEAALSAAPPPERRDDRIAKLRRRAHLVRLDPLDHDEAEELISVRAPDLDEASKAAILRSANGNPQAIDAYTERVAAHGPDERHELQPAGPPKRWPQLVLIIAVLVGVHLARRAISEPLISEIALSAIIILGFIIRHKIRDAIR